MPRSGKLSRSSRHSRIKNYLDLSPPVPAEGALIIFAKAPIPGQVKTRLCPPLNPDEAASLHGSMVMDIAEQTRGIRRLDRFLACTPSSGHAFFQTLAIRYRLILCEQVGDDLGKRMDHALTESLKRGYQYALVIGTDIPALSLETYKRAVSLLKTQDIVLGPTHDGGYYLIGLKRPTPEIFTDISWSMGNVCVLTQEKAQVLGRTVGLLDFECDIDTFEDIQTFMAASPDSGKRKLSTRTVKVFQTLLQRHSNKS